MNSYTVTRSNCPVCRHRSKHVQDIMGKTRCAECPDEICTRVESATGTLPAPQPETPVTAGTLGVGFYSEMSREQLIQEILDFQRVYLMGLSENDLKRTSVQLRLSSAKERLYREAGIEPPSIFGWGD